MSKYKKEIKDLEANKAKAVTTQSATGDISFIRDSLELYKSKYIKSTAQIKHYEKTIAMLENKLSNIVESELSKRAELMDRNKSLQSENESLKESIIHTQNRFTKMEKKLARKENE